MVTTPVFPTFRLFFVAFSHKHLRNNYPSKGLRPPGPGAHRPDVTLTSRGSEPAYDPGARPPRALGPPTTPGLWAHLRPAPLTSQPIPPGARGPAYLVGVDTDGHAEGPRQAKVGQLDHTLVVDEQVLGLQVAVQHPPAVAEVDALQDLVQVALGGVGGRVCVKACMILGQAHCYH